MIIIRLEFLCIAKSFRSRVLTDIVFVKSKSYNGLDTEIKQFLTLISQIFEKAINDKIIFTDNTISKCKTSYASDLIYQSSTSYKFVTVYKSNSNPSIDASSPDL